MEMTLSDLQGDYVTLAQHVATVGAPASPRGIPTREILGATLVFPDVSNLLPVGVGRGVGVAFNAAGAACLVAGVSYPELLVRIAPKFADFDLDGVDRERYGPRSVRQVEGCVRMLMEDPHSREAIVTLQPPHTAAAHGGRVFPCTTSIQFLLRDDTAYLPGREPKLGSGEYRGPFLHMNVCMRSNDVWHGLSGDAFTFAQLQQTVAWALGARTGIYRHFAGSLHVYDKDLDKIFGDPSQPGVGGLHDPDRSGVVATGFGVPDALGVDPIERLRWAKSRARSVLGLCSGRTDLGDPWAKVRRFWADDTATRLCPTCREVTEGATACPCVK